MRKIMLLATMFALIFSFSVNAQQGEVNENKPTIVRSEPVFALPNQPGVVIHNNNVVNNGMGVVGNQPITTKPRVIYRDRPVCITNNNFYYDTAKAKEVATNPPPAGPDKEKVIYYGNSLMNALITTGCILLLLMLLVFLLLDWYRRRHPIAPATPPVAAAPTITIVNPQQPDPKPFVVKDEEVKQAMGKAEKTGSTFVRYGNGGYRIDFRKPEPSPAEENNQQEKKD